MNKFFSGCQGLGSDRQGIQLSEARHKNPWQKDRGWRFREREQGTGLQEDQATGGEIKTFLSDGNISHDYDAGMTAKVSKMEIQRERNEDRDNSVVVRLPGSLIFHVLSPRLETLLAEVLMGMGKACFG